MEIEQILALLLAEIRFDHGMMAKMDTRTKARQDKMMEASLNAC
jgi:hypothetical protein